MMAHYRSLSGDSGRVCCDARDLAAQQQIVERLMSLSADSLNRLLQHGFDLGDTWSYLLFVIGAICFLVALREGFNKGDTYPNYTKLSDAFEGHFDSTKAPLRKLLSNLKAIRLTP